MAESPRSLWAVQGQRAGMRPRKDLLADARQDGAFALIVVEVLLDIRDALVRRAKE